MRINHKTKNFWLPFVLAAGFCLGWPLPATAIITGPCTNCHTMHNSQGSASQAFTAAEWNTSGDLTGTPSSTPLSNLLKTDCVGCHTSASDATVIEVGVGGGTSKIPIVYNTGGPAAGTELAGGNFYWTVGDSNKGHNVAGIAPLDGLPYAPGKTGGVCGNSCHESLVDPVDPGSAPSGHDQTGCEGCHLMVGHHDVGVSGGTGPGNSYRFLSGHGGTGLSKFVENGITLSAGADTFEGVNWGRQNGDHNLDRNLYMPQDSIYDPSSSPYLPLGRWCGGCHGQFHAFGDYDPVLMVTNINGGDTDEDPTTNPWMRHPSGVYIPDAGEFSLAAGGVLDGNSVYDPEFGIPLARGNYDRTANVEYGDQVICISCHKAHGSEWPNALRFDYDQNNAHSGFNRDNGCFFCHRAKDL
jgi:hypothetical protein